MRSSRLIFQFVFEFYDVPTHYHSTIYKKGGARDPGRSFQEAPRLHTGIAKNLDRLNNRIQGQTNDGLFSYSCGEFCKPSFFLVAQRIMLTHAAANRDRQLKSHTVCQNVFRRGNKKQSNIFLTMSCCFFLAIYQIVLDPYFFDEYVLMSLTPWRKLCLHLTASSRE